MNTKAADGHLDRITGSSMPSDYKSVQDGDRLRWFKQLATRGAVRNLTNGVCGEMTLHTSMDFSLLVRSVQGLFPNAALPKVSEVNRIETEENPIDKLVALLADTNSPSQIRADEVATITGIPGRKLGARLKTYKVSSVANLYGWTKKDANTQPVEI